MCKTLYSNSSELEIKKTLERVHKNTGHKSFNTMNRFVKNSYLKNNENFRECFIKEIIKSCKVSQKYQKVPERPRVSFPKASDTNEIVSIDLKSMVSEKKHILYMVDVFSKFIRGQVINDKRPETIIKEKEENWKGKHHKKCTEENMMKAQG